MSGLSAPRAAPLPPTLANKCTMYAHIFAHGQSPDGEKKAEYALQDLLQTTLQFHGVSTSESSSSSSPNPKKRRRAPKAAELEELVTKAQNVDNDVNHSSASVVSPATVAAQLLKRAKVAIRAHDSFQSWRSGPVPQTLVDMCYAEAPDLPHTPDIDALVHTFLHSQKRQNQQYKTLLAKNGVLQTYVNLSKAALTDANRAEMHKALDYLTSTLARLRAADAVATQRVP